MKDCEEIREWYEEHRAKKETHRMQNAKLQLEAKGLAVSINMSQKRCEIQHNGNTVFFYPYTGWFTGKGVKDGRGTFGVYESQEVARFVAEQIRNGHIIVN